MGTQPDNHAAAEPAQPTVGIVVALPEELHAMRALLTVTGRNRVNGDRADYILGFVPSLLDGAPRGGYPLAPTVERARG